MKLFSTNMLVPINKKICRHTRQIGIFPNFGSYMHLSTIYLAEGLEDWSVNSAYSSQDSIQNYYHKPRSLTVVLMKLRINLVLTFTQRV